MEWIFTVVWEPALCMHQLDLDPSQSVQHPGNGILSLLCRLASPPQTRACPVSGEGNKSTASSS